MMNFVWFNEFLKMIILKINFNGDGIENELFWRWWLKMIYFKDDEFENDLFQSWISKVILKINSGDDFGNESRRWFWEWILKMIYINSIEKDDNKRWFKSEWVKKDDFEILKYRFLKMKAQKID